MSRGRHGAEPAPRVTLLAAPPEPGARSARHRRRRALARRRRRRLAAGLAAAAALAGVFAFVGFGTGGGPAGGRSGGPGGDARGRQRTLLVAFTAAQPGGPARRARGRLAAAPVRTVDAALLAAGGGRSAVEVLVPGPVLVTAAGLGDTPFGGLISQPDGVEVTQAALADTMGVTVGGTWLLDPAALDRLVQRLGGIRVTVDGAFRARVPGEGSVTVRGGRQVLDGLQAAAYAVHVGAGQPVTAALPRMQAVLDGLLASLRSSGVPFASLLGRYGGRLFGITAAAAGRLLSSFAAADAGGRVSYQPLPVTAVDSGGGSPLYRVDPGGLASLIHQRLSGAVPRPVYGGFDTVFVEDRRGVRRPVPLVLGARDRLSAAGFRFVGSSTAPADRRARTVVLLPAATAADEAAGDAVARALGVPTGDVELLRQRQSVADILVILGRDYTRRGMR